MDKKITGLRVTGLKKKEKNWINNKINFDLLISNLNFSLSKNNILGIISQDKETKDAIFKLLTNNKIKWKGYQGFIEFKQGNNKNYSLTYKDDEYQKNLAFGFDDENLFQNKTKDTVFSYLERYIIENNIINFMTSVFKKGWQDVYQDSKYHLHLKYSEINLNLQKEIEPIIEEIKKIIEFNSNDKLNDFSYNDKIILMQNIYNLIKNVIKIIQHYEQEFLSYIEDRINDYEKGSSLLKFKEYNYARLEYEKLINQNNQNKKITIDSPLLSKLKNHLKILKLKKNTKLEIKRYFDKLQHEFILEIAFNKANLNKKNKSNAFSYYYPRYYVNKTFYAACKKHLPKIRLFEKSLIIDFIKEIYDLRDYIVNEISALGILSSQKQLKNQAKYITKSIVEKNIKMYDERFKNLIEEESSNIIKKINNEIAELKNEKKYNHINISKLKEYQYDLEEKKYEYYWKIDTEGRKIKAEASKIYANSLPFYNKNKNNLLVIKQNLNFLLDEIFKKHAEEIENINIKSLFSSPLSRIFYDLQSMKLLLFDSFHKFHNYEKIINDIKNNKDAFFQLMLKLNIYKVIQNSGMSLDKLVMNLSYLTLDEKIALEINKIFLNNPDLIIVGDLISKLTNKIQLETLNKLNQYILSKEGLGIYLLDKIEVASRITTDLNIIYNSITIEQGKTNKIIDNPINPYLKTILNKETADTKEELDNFLEKSNNVEGIFKYEIEPDHYVWCNWSQLTRWVESNNIKNKKIRNLLLLDENQNKSPAEINDKYEFEEETIINLEKSNKKTQEQKEEKDMDKNFDHKLVEKNRNKKWVEMQAFSTHDLSKPPFTIILPPPNVTGQLHIGHALDTYIADTIIRYKRNKGFDVKWVAGKDHAGIATQVVVEKKLAKVGLDKYKLGREKFIEEIWNWKTEYSNRISEQWAKLGLALDYPSERFTLDKEANEAVLKVFVSMYNDGLIYRDTKAISWDPKLKTALSSIEVIPTEVKQKLYYVKYPIKNKNEDLVVATTRLETMFSDVAIAINPNDSRFKLLMNETIIHPLTKKEIPIIASQLIDPSFGTGIMKVSAHAIDDIEIIKQNNLEIIECIDDQGKMNEIAKKYQGLDRFEARNLIATELIQNNLIEKIEDIVSNVGYGERSNEPIEILVKPQWFVKMKSLSEKILKNLESSAAVKFIPERFEDVLIKWMENVHDWTISRQLWWGHRIPAWYKDNEVVVQIESPGEEWIQDSDVLDTWFSSALAPFVFLGWPQSNEQIKRYFPTSLLVTGYDIIFFWVSRMYFQSLQFMNDIPFKQVLLHGLVRDAQGRKMSKSLGNGIDPISMIDQYGSDVLRMSLIFNCSPGADINFGDDKIQSARLFINKFWNIARLIKPIEINLDEKIKYEKLDEFDFWILSQFNLMKQNIDNSMNKYEFSIIYKHIYDFIINKFSAWYLEFLKFKNNNYFIHYLFREILITLHPYMPFLSDFLFEDIYKEELLQTKSIEYNPNKNFNSKNIDNLIELITLLRKYREDKRISKAINLNFFAEEYEINQLNALIINKLSNFSIKENTDFLIQSSFAKIFIEQSKEDKNNELEELKKLIEKTKNEIAFNEKFLNNPQFLKNAPAKQVSDKKEKLEFHKKNLQLYLDELKQKEE
ncbi:Fusion of oligopeptide transport protein OppF and Valyl-tRNA synthetase [Metamycoplasma auris 15026]|uniref:Valine--tRNA ligase n=1 Tax=Metamycoplasma auris 15026 TaxID=1188233 RepID=N9VD52_9BACT|nr:valine--tRNA ligase [Metamycoplasma auris]ENY69341.1 Fusion of oligopeptide transport protein OppF and Valyl-tRNA synthetase [Metamycoplasma auris 15026]